jgi:pimeloyl-ACP methyl ester carboxylesterase
MRTQVVETAQGPIETAIVGRGPAVLVIPGCPGGYDQGLIAARLAKGHSFKFIALSRPGYMGTPLVVGDTPESQADAYAALLDALVAGLRHYSLLCVIPIGAGHLRR